MHPLLGRLMGLVPHSLCSVFAAFMQNGPDVARTLSFSAALKTGDRPRQHNSMPQFRDRQTRAGRIAMMGRLDSAELATETGSRTARRLVRHRGRRHMRSAFTSLAKIRASYSAASRASCLTRWAVTWFVLA
jgi:hypothetical protein